MRRGARPVLPAQPQRAHRKADENRNGEDESRLPITEQAHVGLAATPALQGLTPRLIFASNHFHLLVWTRGVALASFMKYLRAKLAKKVGRRVIP
ncbi:hypothetical protein [Archangium violaceum]|uniref:Transposase IS200-like domain-containing protein n=1 Tax=Archangium violaceum Cb vi76 TaxID=1406225 RepID=A0A084SGI3_9BACT|nr:hypothetical protein [Archangium violaceum]KFA87568.1 hypothetical protein Q664_46965 [Archangium violaceum Cb vi76]